MRRYVPLVVAAGMSAFGVAAPLTPTITGFDFNFGAFNSSPPAAEWNTNGVAPDTLDFLPSSAEQEVTAFWPAWPAPPPFIVLNAAGAFGGDFELHVMFTAQDAPYIGPGGVIDVSLTGTGSAPGADLNIFGSIPGLGIPFGLLWAIDLERVSLYGYSNFDAYVLEGVGVIVGGDVAIRNQLIGATGVMRGNLDFLDRPAGWIPPLYDPLGAGVPPLQLRAAYSGETGKGYVVPEPATMLALAVGVALMACRRRRAG